jgi:hypothetical protein
MKYVTTPLIYITLALRALAPQGRRKPSAEPEVAHALGHRGRPIGMHGRPEPRGAPRRYALDVWKRRPT